MVDAAELPSTEVRYMLSTRWSRARVAATYSSRTFSSWSRSFSWSASPSYPGVLKDWPAVPLFTSTAPPFRSTRTPSTRAELPEFSPVSTTTGNSRPLAAWTVMIRTADSSPSGTGTSVTRAPSDA
jgi:hypothetical protein